MRFSNKGYQQSIKQGLPAPGSIARVRIIPDGTEKSQSNAGNPMLIINAEIISEKAKGYRMFDYIVDNADWTEKRLGKLLLSLGFDISNDYDVTPSLIIGREGLVRIKHDSFDGETRAKIAYWLSPKSKSADEPDYDRQRDPTGEPSGTDGQPALSPDSDQGQGEAPAGDNLPF